ncbi:MAG: DUF2080 family transposase-associated protein [Euryarchaeota archaeon]|nr:DUF2080 family transposase-associated protein [Euryarchaeota archaeon]
MRIESEIEDMVKRTVRAAGSSATSARINVPRSWVGKYVLVCLLDESQQQAAQQQAERRPQWGWNDEDTQK